MLLNRVVYKQQNLTVLEAEKSKIMVPADLVSGESCLYRWLSFHCKLAWERYRELSWVSYIRALISIMRAPPQDLITYKGCTF